MKNPSISTQGILFALVGFSIVAIADVCVKKSAINFDPFVVAFYINIFTTLFLLPMFFYKGSLKKVIATKCLKLHFFRSMFMLVSFLCIIYALGAMPISTVYVIAFMSPFILNIMAKITLNEVISPHRWLAIIFSIIGVILAMRPDTSTLGYVVLIACGAPLFSAGGKIILKHMDKNEHWLSYTIFVMLFQTPLLAAIVYFMHGTLLPEGFNKEIFIWVALGGLAFAVEMSLIPQAMKRIDASVFGPMVYIVFPWGIFYGYFIFNDAPDLWTLAGAAIIITSGIFLIYRENKENSKLLKLKQEAEKNGARTR